MTSDPAAARSLPDGLSFTTWTAPDGWPLRRADWASGVGRGSLFFAAGRGDFLEKYLEAYQHWHAGGWYLTTFDWRGQGGSRSRTLREGAATFAAMTGDLVAMLKDWRASTPGPHVAVAHSMGGHLLLRALAERRVALDAVVLVAPMLQVNAGPIPPAVGEGVASLVAALGQAGRRVWKGAATPQPFGSARQRNLTRSRERYEDELFWLHAQPDFVMGPPSWGWIRAAYRSARLAFTAEKLRLIGVPLLFIGTRQDRLVSIGAIKRAARIVPGAQLLMFDHAAHEMLREKDEVRDAAFSRIDRFFDEHAP